jgi:competence protein ComEA
VAAAAAGASAAGSSPSAPLDLNSATLEALENLPGIGPVTAQKILDYRQQHGAFHSVAELQGVPGIGPAHMAQLKGLVIP